MRDIHSQKATEEKTNVGVGVKKIRGQTTIFSLLFLSNFVHLVFLIVYVAEKGSYIYFKDEEIFVMVICDKRQALPQRKKKNILEKEERLRQSFLAGPLLLVNARYSTYKRIDTTYYSRNGTQYIPCKIFIKNEYININSAINTYLWTSMCKQQKVVRRARGQDQKPALFI